MASSYPSAPRPTMQPTAMSEKYEWWRNFSRARVGEMQLDERQLHAEQGVTQRDAGVGEAARIDDGKADAVGLRRVHPVDELVFGIALECDEFVTEARGCLLGPLFYGGQGVGSVHLGLPLA